MGGSSSKKTTGDVQSPERMDNIPDKSSIDSQPGRGEKEEVTSAVVCDVDDLKDGEMREVSVGEGKALLVREKGEYHAIGTKCTHYAAPLVKGTVCNGYVRCPWHGACFNIRNGDIEDFPGLDSLQHFDVEVENGKVKVNAKKSQIGKSKRQKELVCSAPEDNAKFVIVGGGGASATCVETLRQEGFRGKIILVTGESCLPYDRPKLSKAMESKVDTMLLRDANFYTVYDIEVKMNKWVTAVDPDQKEIKFADGESMTYDKLMIATGGSPRQLSLPGNDLENVALLRTPEDSNKIAAQAKDGNVVVIGTSFIGMEFAAYAVKKAKCLTVLGQQQLPFTALGPQIGMEVASGVVKKAKSVTALDLFDIPFKLVLGDEIGLGLKKMHEEKGTKFIAGNSAKEFVGENGKLTGVILGDGTELPADLVVIGVGVTPATTFLKDSGINMNERGFITVNKRMETNKDGVYACGDIVEFPLFIQQDNLCNVQHWQMACQHGRIAALNMLGKEVDVKSVPFFWTVQFGKSLRYCGYGQGYDDIVVHGNVDELAFVAYYTKGDDVVAVASMNYDPIVAQVADMMQSEKKITKAEIKDDPKAWLSRL